MSQLDDLNTAIAAEDVEIQSDVLPVLTKVEADLKALAAAVAAGASPTVLTDQITAIQSHTSAIKTAMGQLAAEDAADALPTTPPAPAS